MIIKSILDTDLYKLTTQQIIRRHFRHSLVRYKFYDRKKVRELGRLRDAIQHQVYAMGELSLSAEDACWLLKLPYFDPAYIDYLYRYRFNPEQVQVEFDGHGGLDITISGPWVETVLWEVPLLAVISELSVPTVPDYKEFVVRTRDKCRRLECSGAQYIEFGTRRRLSFLAQAVAVEEMAARGKESGFRGTSNLLLAKIYGVTPGGSMPHEWIMGVSGRVHEQYANNDAMFFWLEMYGNSSIALTDTFTSDFFFKRCHQDIAENFSGLRQDSGSPLAYLEKAVAFYRSRGIDPDTKTIIFSDGLTTNSAIAINKAACRSVRPVFGIGTHFTNDFPGFPPLNIVIKLDEIDGTPVVKLSDEPDKATGNPVEISRIRQIVEGTR